MDLRSTHVNEGTIDAANDDVEYGRPIARRGGLPPSEPRGTIWAGTLDLMRIAVLILHAECSCIGTNAAAEDLLAATRRIRISSGTLVMDDKDAGRQVASAVASAVHAGPADGDAPVAPTTVVALTLEKQRHFVAEVIALPRAGPTDGIAALLLQEIGKLQPLPGEILVKLYGFTRAEARLVALLAQDLSLEDAAAAMGVARTTAKTHLQRVFEKTGTNRQPQVVRLALSAFAAAPA